MTAEVTFLKADGALLRQLLGRRGREDPQSFWVGSNIRRAHGQEVLHTHTHTQI